MRLTLDLPSTHRPKPDVCSCHTELVNVERVFDSECKIRQGMSERFDARAGYELTSGHGDPARLAARFREMSDHE